MHVECNVGELLVSRDGIKNRDGAPIQSNSSKCVEWFQLMEVPWGPKLSVAGVKPVDKNTRAVGKQPVDSSSKGVET
jgi:hypothetical protein